MHYFDNKQTDINISLCPLNIKSNLYRQRDDAPNTTNPIISLVADNVIPLLIVPPARVSVTLIMYHVDEGTRPCPFSITGNRHGGVTEPQGDQFSGRNLGMIPEKEDF